MNSGNSLNASVNSSSGSIPLNGGSPAKAYITKDTKFILVDVDGYCRHECGDLHRQRPYYSERDAFLIATKSGSSYEASVVIVADDNVSNSVMITPTPCCI